MYNEFMIIKNVTQVGNPIIRRQSKPVKDVKSAVARKIVRDLTDSMRATTLVGMAAPQIGLNIRIFVSEVRTTINRRDVHPDPLRVFINPVIVWSSQEIAKGWEGCGSVAESGLFAQVPRPARVTVRAFDQKGNPFTLKANGLLARIIQHEVDHLDGKVFLDRVTDMTTLHSANQYRAKKK